MAGKGGRPALRLVAVSKEAGPDGKRVYTELGAAWPSDRVEGSFNTKLADGTKVKSSDGKVFSNATHFFNIEPAQRADKSGAADADGVEF